MPMPLNVPRLAAMHVIVVALALWVAGAQLAGREQSAATPTTSASQRPIDYNWDVRPILSDYCFRCHGPDEKGRQANLRLDTPDGAYAALRRPGTFAVVPGRPDQSQVVFRITHENAALRMPPRSTNKVLTSAQIDVIRRWIAEGAPYKPHWAFVPPQTPMVPAVRADRPLTDIDRFVVDALRREGLELSPEADKETLINRVSLTLTGLPPMLPEVDAFVQDRSPHAYEKVVDRLLASPAYAEHMANDWLNIARYAESDGFLDDTHDRLFWPYRDWVIGALNRNMPFDQFATWQLAGDLLPNRTKEHVLATAFLRLGKRTTENGAIDEEYKAEYSVERATTIGAGFLAMTVGCARCHDHKYDPIPTRDFYSLTAFFTSSDEPGFYAPGRTGITAGPTLRWADAATERKIEAAQAAVRAGESAYAAARERAAHDAQQRADALLADGGQLEALVQRSLTAGLVAHYPLEETAPVPDDQLPVPLPQRRLSPPPLAPETLKAPCAPLVSDEACRAPTAPVSRGGTQPTRPPSQPRNRLLGGFLVRDELVHSPSLAPAPPAVLQAPILREGIRGKAMFFDDNNRAVLGTGVGYFERTEPFSIDLWVRPAQVYTDAVLFHHRETENAGNAGYQMHLEQNRLRFEMMHSRAGNGILLRTIDTLPANAWAHVTLTYDGSSRASGVTLYIDGRRAPVNVTRDNLSRTIIPNGAANLGDETMGLSFGGRLRALPMKGGAVDEVRVYRKQLTALEVAALDGQVRRSATPVADRQAIVELLTATDPAVIAAGEALLRERNAENELVSVTHEIMVMGDTPAPQPSHVLVRGQYTEKGEPVRPRGLGQVLPWNDAWPENRIGLAAWLFDRKNPLTARVFVNRIWQMHFGRGIVETSEDFGAQGSIPTHPELLDHLAVTFVESGWDIKRLQKAIVMSATYRQRSDSSDALVAKDPRNLLLARYPRLRMPAEMVRDHALAAGGLLVRRVGGPSVYPYQPPDLWDGFNVYKYPNPDEVPADSHHRRSMYSFVKRNAPHPAMASFDMPDRGATTARRTTSNTPLQALVLLDDPQYLEAYRSLAAHALRSARSRDAQITTVFRLATRRHPRPDELVTLRRYHDAQLRRFRTDREAARQLLSEGVTQADTALDAAALAAMTNVATAVMNTPDAYSLR